MSSNNDRSTRLILSRLAGKHNVQPTQRTLDRIIDHAYPIEKKVCSSCLVGKPVTSRSTGQDEFFQVCGDCNS